MCKHAQPHATVLSDFDLEATAVVTLPKQADADDAQSTSTLCDPSASFAVNINQLQQRHASVSLTCLTSKQVSQERKNISSTRTNFLSGIITNKAAKIATSDDFDSLEIIASSHPFLSDVQRKQRSLKKGTVTCSDDHPKINGYHE